MIGFRIELPTFVAPGVSGDALSGFASNSVIPSVKARILSGITASDQPARALSPRYAKWKLKTGRRPIRDWFLNPGTMLDSMTAREGRDGVVVSFGSGEYETRAAYMQNYDGMMGVSPEDMRRCESGITQIAKDYISRMVARD